MKPNQHSAPAVEGSLPPVKTQSNLLVLHVEIIRFVDARSVENLPILILARPAILKVPNTLIEILGERKEGAYYHGKGSCHYENHA